jgi:hypothetical protein
MKLNHSHKKRAKEVHHPLTVHMLRKLFAVLLLGLHLERHNVTGVFGDAFIITDINFLCTL